MISLKEKYNKTVLAEMKKQFNLSNDFEVPKIKKVVVNVGVGKFLKDNAQVEDIVKAINQISGQKPLMTKARQSIAGFKIREGLEVGVKTTLRGKRMWSFVEKLVGAALPRIKDFHGLKAFGIHLLRVGPAPILASKTYRLFLSNPKLFSPFAIALKSNFSICELVLLIWMRS